MSIRVRLTLWYVGLLALVLVAALAAAYMAHARAHVADDDDALHHEWIEAAADVRDAASRGAITGEVWADETSGSKMFTVWLFDGGRPLASGGALADDAAAVAGLPDGFATITVRGERFRVHAMPVEDPASDRLVVASSLQSLDDSLAALRVELVLLWLAAVAVAAAGGFALSASALRPIALLTETARSIRASRAFSRRVPAVPQKDELGTLAATFNEMLDTLQAAHERQGRFVADVSHELRTPLTTIAGSAELAVADGASAAEREEALVRVRDESSRLARLVDELLVLARADAAAEAFRPQPVELDALLMGVFEELRLRDGSRLAVESIDQATVAGEPDRLKQLLLIVGDNALRYTPPDGRVWLGLARDDGHAVVTVRDEGIGIAPDVAGRLFERFYRGEEARRLDPTGSGLGLAIARWIVERHRGSITLAPRSPRGTTVAVRLPLA